LAARAGRLSSVLWERTKVRTNRDEETEKKKRSEGREKKIELKEGSKKGELKKEKGVGGRQGRVKRTKHSHSSIFRITKENTP